jgi:hypothetical protein
LAGGQRVLTAGGFGQGRALCAEIKMDWKLVEADDVETFIRPLRTVAAKVPRPRFFTPSEFMFHICRDLFLVAVKVRVSRRLTLKYP